jgi:hypothetical protein
MSLAQASVAEDEHSAEETSDIPTAQALRYAYDNEDEDNVSEAQGYADTFGADGEEEEHRYYTDMLGATDEGVEEAYEPILGYGQGYGEGNEDDPDSRHAYLEPRAGAAPGPSSYSHERENGYIAPEAVAQAAYDDLPSPVPNATLTRLQEKRGSVSWELDHLHGLKHLDNQPTQAGSGSLQSTSVAVVGPAVNVGPGDQVAADFEVRWRYNGRSLGDVEIVHTRAEGSGANLHVTATIANDTNIYTTTPPSDARFAGLRVRFHYRFSRAGASPLEADTDVTLYGNGTASKVYRWSQA